MEQRTNCFITAILEKERFSESLILLLGLSSHNFGYIDEGFPRNFNETLSSCVVWEQPSIIHPPTNWRYLSLGHINHGSLPEQSEMGNHLCHSPCHLQTNDCRHINLQQMPSSHTQSTHRVSSKYSLGVPNRLRSWFYHNPRSHILSSRQQHQLYDSRHAWDVYRAIKCYPISSIDHPWTNANSKWTGR